MAPPTRSALKNKPKTSRNKRNAGSPGGSPKKLGAAKLPKVTPSKANSEALGMHMEPGQQDQQLVPPQDGEKDDETNIGHEKEKSVNKENQQVSMEEDENKNDGTDGDESAIIIDGGEKVEVVDDVGSNHEREATMETTILLEKRMIFSLMMISNRKNSNTTDCLTRKRKQTMFEDLNRNNKSYLESRLLIRNCTLNVQEQLKSYDNLKQFRSISEVIDWK